MNIRRSLYRGSLPSSDLRITYISFLDIFDTIEKMDRLDHEGILSLLAYFLAIFFLLKWVFYHR